MAFENITKVINSANQLTGIVKNNTNRYGSKVGTQTVGDLLNKTSKDSLGSFSFGSGNNPGMITNAVKRSGQQVECGYVPDVSGKVADVYLVTIINTDWLVKAVLQDNFNFRVESNWKALEDVFPAPAKEFMDAANAISTILVKKSLMNAYTTRRVWNGTSPIEMVLRLQFEAVYDAYKEVVSPCMALQQMALPTIGDEKGWNEYLPLLTPPGPAPADLKNTPL